MVVQFRRIQNEKAEGEMLVCGCEKPQSCEKEKEVLNGSKQLEKPELKERRSDEKDEFEFDEEGDLFSERGNTNVSGDNGNANGFGQFFF
jgi:hypothetical protein